MEKQKWWKKGIEGGSGGCLCCPQTSELLSLDTKLYNGFGGWCIKKNGKLFFVEKNDSGYEDAKDLKGIEEIIGEDSKNEYLAVIDLPLRSGVYQRHAKNVWVLIEKGDGFA